MRTKSIKKLDNMIVGKYDLSLIKHKNYIYAIGGT